MQIGPYKLANRVIAAPMAGVSDKPYRQVCRRYGVGLAVSEMVTNQLDLRHTTKSKFRLDLSGEPGPVAVQIVGADPEMLAQAARYNVANGAQIIDINMGCPAKKVYKKAAGSALLANEALVAQILQTVVAAVNVPVTVKIRTGISPQARNATSIARIAEDAGVRAITIHGRTRECKFHGEVEYRSIESVKRCVDIPVIANGDINSPKAAQAVLDATKADAIMIGRAAQGQPWLFKQVIDYIEKGQCSGIPNAEARAQTIIEHHRQIHQFYGEELGLRLARKHIKWYLAHWETEIPHALRMQISTTENALEQRQLVAQFFNLSCSSLAA